MTGVSSRNRCRAPDFTVQIEEGHEVRHWIRPLADGARALTAAALTLLVFGCSGSGGSGTTSSDARLPAAGCDDCGTLLLGVTDADGDFVSYSVDVLSMTLERPNGATVETLPGTRGRLRAAHRIADLLSVTTLAPGDFVGGKIRLDYTNAEVFVEKEAKSCKPESSVRTVNRSVRPSSRSGSRIGIIS